MSAVDAELAERVASLPGMDSLLPALEGLPPAYLVGGAVRDLLRDSDGIDLDIAVEGDAVAAAAQLAERLGGEVRRHDRFGTATLRTPGLTADLATTRRERYAQPGALPDVEPAPLAEDLARRDFTINAMALALAPDELGRLHDPHGGLADLRNGALRVLHYRSFREDPTRLLRAVRYEVRLGVTMEEATERWAREAAEAGAPATVSGPRIRDGLLAVLALGEVGAAAARMRSLGLDRALHPRLVADPELVDRAARAAELAGADRVLSGLAALVASAPDDLDAWVSDLGLGAVQRDRVVRAARRGGAIAGRIADAELRPSDLHGLLAVEPPEALALAVARGAPEQPIRHFLADLRAVRLEITGDDLLREGVPPSPAVGRALDATLRRKLDGEVAGREAELATALALAREES